MTEKTKQSNGNPSQAAESQPDGIGERAIYWLAQAWPGAPPKYVAKAIDAPPDTVKSWMRGDNLPASRWLTQIMRKYPESVGFIMGDLIADWLEFEKAQEIEWRERHAARKAVERLG